MRFKFCDRRAGLLVLALTTILFNAAMAAAQSDSLENVVANLKPSVVGIGTFQGIRQPQSVLTGTGFVVADGNHIVTNHHVVVDHMVPVDKEYLVALIGRGQRFEPRQAEVVATEVLHDLALLRISGDPLPPVKFSSRQIMAQEGREIALTGYPIGPVFGLYSVTHRGIVSAVTPNLIPQAQARLLDPDIIRHQRFDVYQLDITAYPGNSGSPLYDAKSGDVVGILNSTFVKGTKERALTDPSGISFAIPVKYIYLMLDKMNIQADGRGSE